MSRVELYREERSDRIEYTIEWSPSRDEKRMGAIRTSMLLTESEFCDLINAGLKYVGNSLRVA